MPDAHAFSMQIAVEGPADPGEDVDPGLVLVGGGLTGWGSWKPFQAELAERRRVMRVQLLAVQYGLEERPLPPAYSVGTESEAMANAVAGFCEDGPIDIAAWSYGGSIALDFALNHPHWVRTLTLIEPNAFWVLDATGQWDAESQRENRVLKDLISGMTGDVTEQDLAAFLDCVGLCPPGVRPDELEVWPTWVAHRQSLRIGLAPWHHRVDAERLRELGAPVLLVKGVGSAYDLRRVTDVLAALLPNVELVELAGGHAPHIVEKGAFLERMDAFHRGH